MNARAEVAMTTKPATPLPWYVDESDAEGRTVSTSDSKAIAETGLSYSRLTGGGKQNAAYIVHAANAYPELVAALREIVEESRDRETAQGVFQVINDKARSALAKLGESA